MQYHNTLPVALLNRCKAPHRTPAYQHILKNYNNIYKRLIKNNNKSRYKDSDQTTVIEKNKYLQ